MVRTVTSVAALVVAALGGAPGRADASGRAMLAAGLLQDTTRARRDTAATDTTKRANPLDIDLTGRLETRAEQNRNDRCFAAQLQGSTFTCRSRISPTLDFQFNLRSAGTIADRVSVDVDYDSQREFDGSNNISLSYQGKAGEFLQRLEVGNVSFAPPSSRFLTSGIPSGNYGIQALAQRGPLSFAIIAAQQKGTVVKDQVFTIGARVTQRVERELEEDEIEPRRFFFTVDPIIFGSAYPNIDILDSRRLTALAASLPDSLRPSRVFLYRLILGGQPPNPNGPRFRIIDDPDSRSGHVYELLREGVDYYLDPSQLWFALVRPLALANERLVVAWTLRINGRDTTIAHLGGTPDLEYIPGREQLAHLVWDPRLSPRQPQFRREIRSVYRIGGNDIRRESVALRIVTGTSPDQEKPPAGSATYLTLFGLAALTSPSQFDAENRLWPRPNDPNVAAAGSPGSAIIRDQFLVFPSLQPFARRGLATNPAVPANDTLYQTPSEFLYSSQQPQSFYRIRAEYEVQGGSGGGTIALSAVQLRPGSERITLDGAPLMRGLDYDIDYDLGRVTILRADTLSARPRRVVVRYEENPIFASVPTSVIGLSAQWTLANGRVGLLALSQGQRSTFTRPPLGFEPQGSLTAGVNAQFGWNLTGLGDALRKMSPWSSPTDTLRQPRLDVHAEIAMSRPRQRGSQQAYLESFEGDGGISVSLFDTQWQYGSQPSLGRVLPQRLAASVFDTSRAASLAFQTNGTDRSGRAVIFRADAIDTLATFAGSGFAPPEVLLWLTLYPLSVGGARDPSTGRYDWTIATTPAGRRWRSVRTALGTSGSGAGVDLSRVEHVEFWTLADTSAARRNRNPLLILDFGDVSENTVLVAPDTLRPQPSDSLWAGRRIAGLDTLDTERDPFSRAFSADANDTGLPGDRLRTVRIAGGGVAQNVPFCTAPLGTVLPLGDERANCTIRNSRLDEEDIDQDGALNFTSAEREREQIRRFIVDLSAPATYSRIGKCGAAVNDINSALPPAATRCWVQVRVPFAAPDDSSPGGFSIRRVRALRVTVVSGQAQSDADFTLVPLARLRLTGAAWLKRNARPLRGIGGDEASRSGSVVAAVIGTQDRDSLRGLVYEPPPGVGDAPDQQQVPGAQRVQINERSMRLLAVGMDRYTRAETYYRFPEGQRSVMSYRELRLWARGRGAGWGPQGDLQFFVKMGRDANNFYAYRTPINSGPTRSAWEPEIRVRFSKLLALRARLQRNWLSGGERIAGCTAADSALILASGTPTSTRIDRYAVCEDGYMVYTVDPAVAPPNLAAVQELAAGIVRVDSLSGANPPLPGDTLELWVDDIRLADVVNEVGYAGEVGVTLDAGDFGTLRFTAGRRDANFRQLAEQPTFVGNTDVEVSGTWQLDRLLPRDLGLSIPLTVTHTSTGADPLFLSRSDVRGDAVQDLRAPQASHTTYSLGVRRRTPLVGPWYAPFANALGVVATWTGNGNQSEYQRGSARNFNIGVEFLDIAESAAPPLGMREAIGALLNGGSPFAGAQNPLMPTTLHVSSNLERATDRRESFLKPASATDDTARVVRGDEYQWRTSTNIELRPFAGVTARWDALTLRDLRDYGNATPNASAASRERGTFAGLDVGLERERRYLASVAYAPAATGWLAPRFEYNSSYSMVRDPDNRVIVDDDDLFHHPRLQRRFGNTQRVSASAGVNLTALSEQLTGEGSVWHTIAKVFRPVDIAVSRDLLSAYDGAAVSPTLGYQFALGGLGDFREFRGILAASAGSATQVSVSNALTLPFGATIAGRVQRGTSRHLARRLDERHGTIDGAQDILPDVTLRWAGTPPMLSTFFTTLGVTARLTRSRQAYMTPPVTLLGEAERRATRITSTPLSFQAVTGPGNVSLTASLTRSERIDSLPGTVGTATSREMSADMSRHFPLPASWQMKSGLRARMSFQQSNTVSYVSNAVATGARSRLTDNGRRSFSLNADTDVAENMTFSLQGSRVVTFDRNFNRQFTQTVLSAVLQIQFFGGGLR